MVLHCHTCILLSILVVLVIHVALKNNSKIMHGKNTQKVFWILMCLWNLSLVSLRALGLPLSSHAIHSWPNVPVVLLLFIARWSCMHGYGATAYMCMYFPEKACCCYSYGVCLYLGNKTRVVYAWFRGRCHFTT